MRKVRPFVISVIAHAFLLVAVLVPSRPLQTPSAPQLMTIDIVSLPSETSSRAPRASKNEKKYSGLPDRRTKEASKSLKLSDLAVGKNGELHLSVEPNKTNLVKRGRQRKDGFALAQGMDLATESELYPFFHGLWKKIDASLAYPSDFVKARIEGSVQLQFEVDERGVLTGRLFRLDADSNHLAAYLSALLVHALSSPLPKQDWETRGKINIVARFDFDIFTTARNTNQAEAHHLKNILYFKRSAYAQSRLNEYIEKFYARYVPPIIPIPGGFVIDFYRAYKMIEAIGKPDPDDLRDDRIQLMMGEWSKTVRKEDVNESQAHY